MAIVLDMQRGISHEDSNIIEFSVIDVASAIGWDSGIVKNHLKNLEYTTGSKDSTKFLGKLLGKCLASFGIGFMFYVL